MGKSIGSTQRGSEMNRSLEQAAPGEPSNPETWVEQHGDVLFRYARGRLRDPAVAEEVVQETCVSALQARERVTGRASERTWLVGILKHKIIDHCRRTKRERPVESVEALTEPSDEQFDGRGHWKVDEEVGPREWGSANPEALLQQTEFLEVLERCLSK